MLIARTVVDNLSKVSDRVGLGKILHNLQFVLISMQIYYSQGCRWNLQVRLPGWTILKNYRHLFSLETIILQHVERPGLFAFYPHIYRVWAVYIIRQYLANSDCNM
jgi:hypothetical protein